MTALKSAFSRHFSWWGVEFSVKSIQVVGGNKFLMTFKSQKTGWRAKFDEKSVTELLPLMRDSFSKLTEELPNALLPLVSPYLCYSDFSVMSEWRWGKRTRLENENHLCLRCFKRFSAYSRAGEERKRRRRNNYCFLIGCNLHVTKMNYNTLETVLTLCIF